jgi:hypothetical protein
MAFSFDSKPAIEALDITIKLIVNMCFCRASIGYPNSEVRHKVEAHRVASKFASGFALLRQRQSRASHCGSVLVKFVVMGLPIS